MALPLALGLVGAGATAGIAGSLFGGSDKTIQKEYSYQDQRQVSKKINRTSSFQSTFSPQTDPEVQFSPTVNLDSPGATTKKEQGILSTPAQEVTPTASIPTTQVTRQQAQQASRQGQGASGGMDKLLFTGLLVGGGYLALQYLGGGQG